MNIRRAGMALVLAVLMVLGGASSALADHTHVRLLPNGKCVVLAANGGEKYVQLPGYDDLPENRQHPLHVKAHLGKPGTKNGDPVIFVLGSPEERAACTQGYVNAP